MSETEFYTQYYSNETGNKGSSTACEISRRDRRPVENAVPYVQRGMQQDLR